MKHTVTKLLLFALIGVLLLSLAGCKWFAKKDPPASDPTKEQGEQTAEHSGEEGEKPDPDDGKDPDPSGGNEDPDPSGGNEDPDPSGGNEDPDPSGGNEDPAPGVDLTAAQIVRADAFEITGETLSLTVANAVSSYDFTNAVTVSEGASWQLFSSGMGQAPVLTPIADKTVTLEIGENTFYIRVTSGNGQNVTDYTVRIYRKALYTLTFRTEGGTPLVPDRQVEEGAVTAAPQITRQGYTFAGWDFDFTKPVTANATVTAAWTANTYTVSYDPNGGALNALPATVTYGIAFTLPVPTREGYAFAGWKFGTRVLTDHEGNGLAVWDYAGNKTVVASWTANEYTLTLEKSIAAAGTVTGAGDYAYGATATVKATSAAGYVWLGWYNAADERLTANASYSFTVTSAATLTAKWIACPVTLVCDVPAGGTVGAIGGNLIAGQQTSVTAATNSGYVWCGWYRGSERITENLTLTFEMPTEPVTYTAKWIACPVTLVCDVPAGGTVDALDGAMTAGQEITVEAATNSGYVWCGWYRGSERITEDLTLTFEMPTEPVTYTAKWIACPVTLVCDVPAGGTVGSIEGDLVAGQQTSVTAATNNGYAWCGWYCGEELLTEDTTLVFYMPIKAVTYTAKWIALPAIGSDMPEIGTVSGLPATAVVGDSLTVTATEPAALGYVFAGWYAGDVCVNETYLYTFTLTETSPALVAHYRIDPALEGLTFTSTATACTITGVTDRTVTMIAVPDYVTVIADEAFADCTALDTLTLPDTLTVIGARALRGCTALVRIYYGGTQQMWQQIEKGTDWDASTGSYGIRYADEDIISDHF